MFGQIRVQKARIVNNEPSINTKNASWQIMNYGN